MIDRRSFTLALGATLLSWPAQADTVPLWRKKRKKPLKDIPYIPIEQIPNHRQLMRDIVIELSSYGKKRKPGFIVVVRNGPELLVKEQRERDLELGQDPKGVTAGKYPAVGTVIQPYLDAIDGMLIDGAFYGQEAYGAPTDPDIAHPLLEAADKLRKAHRRVLSIEYCTDAKLVASIEKDAAKAGLLAYVDRDGDKRLGRIPPGYPPNENAAHVTDLHGVHNFLPLLNTQRFDNRGNWITALTETNYDLLAVDVFWHGTDAMTANDVETLKTKRLGTRRLVLADLPVGRARNPSFYWQPDWSTGKPPWLAMRDPQDASQTIVEFWSDEWKVIIGKYMQGLVDLGFDGVLLDYVDTYLPFEDLTPLE
jgi:endo-alpha-1,4-polygalactosaminidase (GH114 family)